MCFYCFVGVKKLIFPGNNKIMMSHISKEIATIKT